MGFPGVPVVRNPLYNAGDTGSIPGLEDPTCHAATKPMCHICLSLHTLSWCSITREATAMRSQHASTRQESPLTATRESPHSNEDPVQPKINT